MVTSFLAFVFGFMRGIGLSIATHLAHVRVARLLEKQRLVVVFHRELGQIEKHRPNFDPQRAIEEPTRPLGEALPLTGWYWFGDRSTGLLRKRRLAEVQSHAIVAKGVIAVG